VKQIFSQFEHIIISTSPLDVEWHWLNALHKVLIQFELIQST